MTSSQTIKKKIHQLVKAYLSANKNGKFIPGKTPIQYAGAVYDEKDINAIIDSLLNGWFGLSVQGEQLEKELAEYVGSKQAYLVNSGSSADLLAIATLSSYQLPGHLAEGDEVITPACTFPTLVASLVHHRLIPVFVDVDLKTLNPTPEQIEEAITPKTKAIFVVHTLGNPNKMDQIMQLAKKHNLFVIEDNCDALGSTYRGQKTGSFGIMATESFYPAHHITTAGEGGAVLINSVRLNRITQSLREWGRACWCGAAGGPSCGACGNRFNFKLDGVPYDHKYIFSQVGYNLKPIELQAAMGRVQLAKLNSFIEIRKQNFAVYDQFFKQYDEYFIRHEATINSDPSWFAYPITIKETAPFSRFEFAQYLESHNIQTRPVFAGNILKQPGYKNIRHKVADKLTISDVIFKSTLFIGVYPGLTPQHIAYVQEVIDSFIKKL